MSSREKDCLCHGFCIEELEEKARKLAAFPIPAITAGNTIVVFAMLILHEILEQQALNPVTNFNNIISIANSIAGLNTSIRVVDP